MKHVLSLGGDISSSKVIRHSVLLQTSPTDFSRTFGIMDYDPSFFYSLFGQSHEVEMASVQQQRDWIFIQTVCWVTICGVNFSNKEVLFYLYKICLPPQHHHSEMSSISNTSYYRLTSYLATARKSTVELGKLYKRNLMWRRWHILSLADQSLWIFPFTWWTVTELTDL